MDGHEHSHESQLIMGASGSSHQALGHDDTASRNVDPLIVQPVVADQQTQNNISSPVQSIDTTNIAEKVVGTEHQHVHHHH